MSRPRRSRIQALPFLLLLALVCASPDERVRAQAVAESSSLLETGRAAKLREPSVLPVNIKLVSYNIRWRGGEDLNKLIALLRNDAEVGGATIIGLQEVDRNRKRTGNANTARRVAEELGMYYAWAAPPPPVKARKPQEEETGVAIFSLYPLTDVSRIVLPNEGPNGRRRVAVGATIKLKDAPAWRVYSVHGETRMSVTKKIEAFQAVLDDLARYEQSMPSVVLGDFNTIEGDAIRDVTSLFTKAGFTTPFTNSEETWKTFIFKLKLDWLWLRNLRALEHGIDHKIGLSDHWPLWTTVTLKQ